MADPTRRAMLARLSRGEASVKELMEPFALSAPAISKHLKVLERSGLITRRRDAQWRPCQFVPAPIAEAAAWMEQCRVEQEAQFDRLGAYLQSLQGGAAGAARTSQDKQVFPARDDSRDPTVPGA